MTQVPPTLSSVTVRATSVYRQELSQGGRAAYAVLGAIAFILGLYLLISGVLYGTSGGSGYFAQGFLEWLVILALFLVGVTTLLSGALRADGASTGLRAAKSVIGAIVIVLGIVAIWPVLYPGNAILGISAFTFLWVLVAFAFTLEGIFLILIGTIPNLEPWERGMAIVLGVVVLIFGILSWAFPSFAVFVVWIAVSIALLAFGLRFLITGVSGVRVRSTSSEVSIGGL